MMISMVVPNHVFRDKSFPNILDILKNQRESTAQCVTNNEFPTRTTSSHTIQCAHTLQTRTNTYITHVQHASPRS